jgi:hypothetical protein
MTDANPTVVQHRTNPKPLAVALLASFGLFLVVCGVVSLCVAFSSDVPLRGRLLMIAMAAVSLFLPVCFELASSRMKWSTGRWTLPPEERQARLRRTATEKPWRIVRFASSLAFRNVVDGIMVVLAVMNIWLLVREGIHAFQLIIVIVWTAVAALSLWQLLHRHRAARES